VKAAFYKGTRPGLQGWYNRIVRCWTRGIYSHVELVFPGDLGASASYVDGGVRIKPIQFDESRWDFIDLPNELETEARAWFAEHTGQPYDLMGNVRFLIGTVPEDRDRWFCSEAIAEALGFADSWRFEPNILYAVLRRATQ
jgi:hypothetical protein